MNCEGCEDIRLVERIFNSPGMLYADTFQRGMPPDKLQPRDRYELSEIPHLLDDLRNDKTKPVWNCRMRFPPNFVAVRNWKTERDNIILQDIHEKLGEFAYRLKNEQEDESSIQINVDYRDLQHNKSINLSEYTTKIFDWIRFALNARKQQWLRKQSQGGALANHVSQVIDELSAKLRTPTDIQKLTYEAWISLFDSYLVKMFDSETTATVFAVMPNIGSLNLLVNPMMFALHMNLAKQVQEAKKKPGVQQQKAPNPPKPNSDKYPDHKSSSCSKVVFINLDGYESQLNIEFARNFHKLIMYISFPRQNMISGNEALKYESSRMLSKYYCGDKSANQSLMNNLYEAGYAANKNIYVFPVNSQKLSSQMGKSENKDCLAVQQYESNFIYYMFKEVVYTQISDFNPAVIMVSYSGKLNIQNYHFIEIIKDLTKIANYKVMLFPNLTKTYIMDDIDTRDNMQLQVQRSIFVETEKRSIYLIDEAGGINVDLLEKLSIFLKIVSGTYNLNQSYQFDSFTEKYRNGKILAYSSQLIEQLKNQNEVLNKIQTRSQDLKAIAIIINKEFKQDKYKNCIDETVGDFHKELMKQVEKRIKNQGDDMEEEDEGVNLLGTILNTYPGSLIDGVLQSFKFEYFLEVATEKIYKKTYVTIVDHKSNRIFKNLVFCQFEIQVDGRSEPMNIRANHKLLYDKENRSKDDRPLIYLTNYLHKTAKQQKYGTYYGRVDRKSHRIVMKPVQFNSSPETAYSIYTDWNYHQTDKYIFLYWPRMYNFIYSMLSKILGKTYTPQIENIVYRASVEKPGEFEKLDVILENKKEFDPRYGCTSYSIHSFPDTTNIFIFGGFFNKEKNYMCFQNCITRFKVSGNRVLVKDFSKSLKIDAVRPRIHYDVQELSSQGGITQIALIGGYGKNFSRPYSLMSSVYYRVTLNSEELLGVKRVKLSKSYCINLPKPIRTRGPTNMKVITNDESLLMQPQNIGRQSYTYHNCQYTIDKDTITDTKQFEFGILQHQIYLQEIDELRRTPQEVSNTEINLKIHRGQHHFMNYVTLELDGKLQLLQLLFEVPQQIKMKHEYIGDVITLSSVGIQYLVHNGVFLYALLRHPFYTNNKTYFVQFNVMTLNNVIIPDSDLALKMQLKHRFINDVRAHILIARDKEVAVLHGPSINNEKHPEYIIKKSHTISEYAVKECPVRMTASPLPNHNVPFLLGSIFIKSSNYIHCFSFASREDGQIEYSHCQLPPASNKKFQWTIITKPKIISFTVDKIKGIDWIKNNNVTSLKIHKLIYEQNKQLDLVSLKAGNIIMTLTNFNELTSTTMQFRVQKNRSEDTTMETKDIARLDKTHLWNTL